MGRVLPLLLVACLAVLAAGHKSLEGYRVYRLQPITTEQFEWVRGMQHDPALDFWSNSDVMVSPERQETFLDQLQREGIQWETLVNDVQ
ncbi:Zinc carboxypeptidase A 1, partial [Gryllus bimaculatus]